MCIKILLFFLFAFTSFPSIFVPTDGRIWVIQIIQRYPEILWLADRKEEAKAVLGNSSSEQFFGQKCIEFDRTLMRLRSLKLILDGSDYAYEMFTGTQPEETRLARESFAHLHAKGKALLATGWGDLSEWQMVQAMETALILGDMGKSGKARELFAPYGVRAPDPDNFYGEAMEVLKDHPELSASFARLPPSSQSLLSQTALKSNALAANDPTILAFYFFVYTCDIAGALGDIDPDCSLTYTEPTHQAMKDSLLLD